MIAAASFGWQFHPELDVMEIAIGDNRKIASLDDAINILKTLVGAQFSQMRGLWLQPGREVEDDFRALLHAETLDEIYSSESGSALIRILDNRAIDTWFQPIFETGGLKLWGYECLMRAFDGDQALSPGELISQADKQNLLFNLDRICRERHIENAARFDVPDHCHFLINFLPTVIYDPAVCLRTTLNAVKKSGLHPSRIIFEVVESHAVSDTVLLRSILDQYREWGFKVALDDVGAGNSGLMMLASLEPDLIKIDRAIVAASVRSNAHKQVFRSLVDIGHRQKKLVLAEGVETREEYEVAESLNADLIQGFLLGKPQPEPVLRASTTPA